MDIIKKLNEQGDKIFIRPEILYAYEELIFGANVKGKRMTLLGSNTYRGFHRINKNNLGAKKYFDECLMDYKEEIIRTLKNIKNESSIDELEDAITKDLKKRLKKNISTQQLKSYNKLRKPIDIAIDHISAMSKDFNINERKRIIPLLYLPLDSQMFQSEIVFSNTEIKTLKLKRTFTFKDILDREHYIEIQSFLKEKAQNKKLKSRIFYEFIWRDRYLKHGKNLFETN